MLAGRSIGGKQTTRNPSKPNRIFQKDPRMSSTTCGNTINHVTQPHLLGAVLGLLAAAPHRQAVVARAVASLPGKMLAEKLQDEHASALHLSSSNRRTVRRDIIRGGSGT